MSSAMDDLRKKKAQADRVAEINNKKWQADRERGEAETAMDGARHVIGGIKAMAGSGYSCAILYRFFSDRSGVVFGRNRPKDKAKALAAERVIELAAEFGYEAKLACLGYRWSSSTEWEVAVRWA